MAGSESRWICAPAIPTQNSEEPKNIAIPANRLDKALQSSIAFDFDGFSIEGVAQIQDSDIILRPDVSTFATLP